MYWPNSHVLWKMNASITSLILKVFVMSQTLCQKSSQLRRGEEKILEDLKSSSCIYKWSVSNSTLSCNKYFTLILILFVGEKIDLNLNFVYISTSNLNVSRRNVLLARSVWANYCFYPTITQPAHILVTSTKNSCAILHTITVFCYFICNDYTMVYWQL